MSEQIEKASSDSIKITKIEEMVIPIKLIKTQMDFLLKQKQAIQSKIDTLQIQLDEADKLGVK